MKSHTATPTAGDPPVVFVYSCFRGSSTWFWSRLRAQQGFCCYYEIFNEQLERLLPADVSAVRPGNWRSHHPDGEPYLLEFAPLLGSEPGVPGFPTQDPPGSRFIGHGGIEGPLDQDVREYVSQLVRHASADGRVPVLTDPRLLARAAGFRAAFGGTHILLVRNLFEQWISVCGQWRAGNDYFLRMVFNQLRCGGQDPFFAFLLSRVPEPDRAHFEDWVRDANLDLVLACYVALHIYLLLRARRHCDLVVDITQLEDADYRKATEASLAHCLGVDIGLGDFERRVDYPKRFVQSPQDCRKAMTELVERALAEADANADEGVFAHELLDAVWKAHGEFMAYTTGARDLIECDELNAGTLEKRLGEVEREHARYAASMQAALKESQTYAASLAAAQAEAMRHAESLEAELKKVTGDATAERQSAQAALAEAARHAASLDAELKKVAGDAAAERQSAQAALAEAARHAKSLQAGMAESQRYAESLQAGMAELQRYAESLRDEMAGVSRDAAAERDAAKAALAEASNYNAGIESRLQESQLALERMRNRFRVFKALWPRESQSDGNEGS